MLSKLLRPSARCKNYIFNRQSVRKYDYLPPSQYDIPLPKQFNLGYAATTYWELIPLFASVVAALAVLGFHITWAIRNKVFFSFNRYIVAKSTLYRL